MLLPLAIAFVAALFAYVMTALPGLTCKHVDEDGRSLLIWESDHKNGLVRGLCPRCDRRTAGWLTSFGLTPITGPRGRKATAEEAQQAKWRHAAHKRTANRMRA